MISCEWVGVDGTIFIHTENFKILHINNYLSPFLWLLSLSLSYSPISATHLSLSLSIFSHFRGSFLSLNILLTKREHNTMSTATKNNALVARAYHLTELGSQHLYN